MVSTPTTRNRLELIGTGDKTNTWGSSLNSNVFTMVDEAMDGVALITVSGNVTLTSTNYTSDQARMRQLWLSGAGGFTVTIPGVEKWYLVRNACSAAVTFSAGGATASVPASQSRIIFTNGTDVYVEDDGASLAYVDATFLKLTGGTMTGPIVLSGAPTANLNPATKAYVDALAFAAVDLPAQGGNAGKFVTTDGSVSSWSFVSFASLTGKPTTISGYGITDAEPLWTIATTTGNVSPALHRYRYLVDTGTAARTITLAAAPADGDEVIIIDKDTNAETNTITIGRNGKTIATDASDLILNVDGAAVRLRYRLATANWEVYRL